VREGGYYKPFALKLLTLFRKEGAASGGGCFRKYSSAQTLFSKIFQKTPCKKTHGMI